MTEILKQQLTAELPAKSILLYNQLLKAKL